MEDILSMSGSVLAILLYLPTLYYIWTDQMKQSFATWFLWVALDVIALASILAQGGENSLILKCYVGGGTLVWFSLLCKKQFKWGRVEWCTLGLVIICLEVWALTGPRGATVMSTLAVCFSGYPQYRESREGGQDKITGYVYLGYSVVNVLFFFAGKSWSIEDRFYGGMVVPLCIAISWAAFQKKPTVIGTQGAQLAT